MSGLATDPAGDAGADVGVDHPDDLERRAHLHAHARSRIDRVDVPGHHGKLARAQAEHRMAESVDAVPFDVGDRADPREVEIAGDHRDRQRRSRDQRAIALLADDPRRAPPRRTSAPCRAAAADRPAATSARGEKPDAASGVTIGVIPASAAPETGIGQRRASTRPACGRPRAHRSAGISGRHRGRPDSRRATAVFRFGRDPPVVRPHVLDHLRNGVTPAIGSLANSQANATAPSSLPSM